MISETDRILTKEISRRRTPSVQYYLFDEHKILHHFHSGLSNIATGTLVDEDTSYHAFSVTKTFTALAALQLAEKGVIALDNPVIQYLPVFRYGDKITIRQLLTHSAGIPNPVPLAWIHLGSEHNTFDASAFFKPIFEKHQKAKCQPNERFSYSNLGYVILGMLIESVTATPYTEYITHHIIQRLGLENGTLSFQIPHDFTHAIGYHKKNSFSNLLVGFFIDKKKYMDRSVADWKPFKNFYVNGTSYGGLIGKPVAFVKYIQALLRTNSILISNEYKQLLFTENLDSSRRRTGMCLSWFAGQLHGKKYFAHAGGGGGYYCEIRIYPDEGLGSIIFFNRTGMRDERYLDKVDKYYFQ